MRAHGEHVASRRCVTDATISHDRFSPLLHGIADFDSQRDQVTSDTSRVTQGHGGHVVAFDPSKSRRAISRSHSNQLRLITISRGKKMRDLLRRSDWCTNDDASMTRLRRDRVCLPRRLLVLLVFCYIRSTLRECAIGDHLGRCDPRCEKFERAASAKTFRINATSFQFEYNAKHVSKII